jgi:hypothetical protein
VNWPPIDYRDVTAPVLPISAPPCPGCRNWAPQIEYRQTSTGFEPNGLVCCHAESMLDDFSCFQLKGAA